MRHALLVDVRCPRRASAAGMGLSPRMYASMAKGDNAAELRAVLGAENVLGAQDATDEADAADEDGPSCVQVGCEVKMTPVVVFRQS